mmetsp:Transcript_89196/g.186408  ORF Transcript_89196/g.186408 Transcript_89196/m.186408 type:complete len:454 (+) Transcript_89196:51-1412(+)
MPPLSGLKIAGACATGLLGSAGYAYWKSTQPPVVVIGGGVMGLATAERIRRTGQRVVLIDAGHPIRGSWGLTRGSHLRIEDPTLLKMGVFSIRKWKDLQTQYSKVGSEEETHFYHRSGALVTGPGALKVADALKKYCGDVPEAEHEVLSASEGMKRYPQLGLKEGECLLDMPEGYTMLVPNAMACLGWAGRRAGVHCVDDAVVFIDREKKVVVTERGQTCNYSHLVLTAGPWTNRMLSMAKLRCLPLFVSKEQTVELSPREGAPSHDWDNLPLFSWSEAGFKGKTKDGSCRYFYTTPKVGFASSGSVGVKIGAHREGPLLRTEDFEVPDDFAKLTSMLPNTRKEFCGQQYEMDEFAWLKTQEFAKEKLPMLKSDKPEGFMRCLYQMTPDMKMILGKHPDDEFVTLACGFSGSGFQFAPAIADFLAATLSGKELSSFHKEMEDQFTANRFLSRL